MPGHCTNGWAVDELGAMVIAVAWQETGNRMQRMAVKTLSYLGLIPHPSRPGRMEKTKGKSEIAFV